ncbi:MAG: BamA/TamA family outer membrane protein [Vicinamibacterales bacterium]
MRTERGFHGFLRFLAFLGFVGVASVAAAQAPGVVTEVRVHGNHTTPDADVLAIAAVPVGAPATDALVDGARTRLEASRRFDGVEVRRRYASIDDPTQIAIILLVDEVPGVSGDDLTPGPLRRLAASGMWLPIVGYEDGYGVTYGARLALADPLGPRSRISVPLTWGGERRAAVEVERGFTRGLVSRLAASAGITRRENPHDGIADRRRGVTVRAERALAPWLRVAATAGAAEVAFLDTSERATAAGVEAVVDTRLDPTFPRNAVRAAVSAERARFGGRPALRRSSVDLAGYVGLVGASVLALRAEAALADAPLPRYERALIGGQRTLRGAPAGLAAGDNRATLTAELRVPITSPLSIGRFGVKAFVDAATVWDAGQTIATRPFTRGTGAGLFMGASLFTLDVDLARSAGHTRWSVGMRVGL